MGERKTLTQEPTAMEMENTPGQRPKMKEVRETVRMRDDTALPTTVILPEGKEKRPCVLVRAKDVDHQEATIKMHLPFVEQGYVLVVQLARSGLSDSPNHPKVDKNDSVDTMQWLARQKWHNGEIYYWQSINMKKTPPRASH